MIRSSVNELQQRQNAEEFVYVDASDVKETEDSLRVKHNSPSMFLDHTSASRDRLFSSRSNLASSNAISSNKHRLTRKNIELFPNLGCSRKYFYSQIMNYLSSFEVENIYKGSTPRVIKVFVSVATTCLVRKQNG